MGWVGLAMGRYEPVVCRKENHLWALLSGLGKKAIVGLVFKKTLLRLIQDSNLSIQKQKGSLCEVF
jgi:hypothetical protein